MPTRRSPRPRPEHLDASNPTVPSVLEAACALPENEPYTWVNEVAGGSIEHGSTVSALFAICSECPVRVACLEYSMSFPKGQAIGVWGGSAGSERTRCLPPKADPRWEFEDSRREVVARAVELLEATFEQRRKRWARFAVAERRAKERGERRPKHPTASLLSKPSRPKEAAWAKGTDWRDERDGRSVAS
jgi:hypothetical protein